jgi:hypothetical protein
MPDTTQKNGIVERKNKTLVECAHSMLQGKNISNGFWEEAINTIVYLKYLSPTKILDLQNPFEFFHGYKLDVSHLRVFGCKFLKMREENLMQNQSSVYLLAISLIPN